MHTILLFLTFFFLAMPVGAQEVSPSENSLTDQEIADLLTTLEDPAKRDAFIENLKNLHQAQEEIKGEETLPALSKTLKLDEGTSKFMKAYDRFLEATGLTGTALGKIGLSAITVLVTFVLLFVIRKLGVLLRSRVMAIKEKLGLQHGRLRLYSRLLRYTGYILVSLLSLYTLNVIWDMMDMSFMAGDIFGGFVAQILSVALIILIAILLWEVLNAVLDNIVHRAGYKDSMRLQTVMPIVRNVLLIVFGVLFILVLLSELGINIIPLLAGAGVLGIAVGFGAQTMVKDFLTGFTIILEDLIQVGDVATLGGKTGLIEKITIRKVQMRDLSGIVYTVPFSDVGIIENWTKQYSYYLMDIGVAYREDTDEVIALLREVDEDLRQDENFKDLILEPIEILGVDAFADSAVIIKARIKTRPIKQWEVGREFNRRMKYKFDEHGIEIPFPHQTLYFGVDKQGKAPPAPVIIEDKNKSDGSD